MSLKLEDAVPLPHLFSGRSATWPSSYTPQASSLGSSPALKSPQPPHTYSRMHESPMSSHNINNLPTTGWYDASVTANDFQVCPVHSRCSRYTNLTVPVHWVRSLYPTSIFSGPFPTFVHVPSRNPGAFNNNACRLPITSAGSGTSLSSEFVAQRIGTTVGRATADFRRKLTAIAKPRQSRATQAAVISWHLLRPAVCSKHVVLVH
jgi:hypothetical protein